MAHDNVAMLGPKNKNLVLEVHVWLVFSWVQPIMFNAFLIGQMNMVVQIDTSQCDSQQRR